ncbi:chondroitin sulfate synthase 1 isoform X2 [Tribolium madens]|uniref:chondroitin sulfate synthase 1 isoform X2 n=1 Tax=Tribolium madens TaxID=41895 RepID=UPI001CF75A50|nr:chondroitin sulfate synthase 1 isoform X2 [Tribolium madens]
MSRRKRFLKLLFGLLLGVLVSQFTYREPVCDLAEDGVQDPVPGHGLVLVGVMTAAKYLDTRARAVYDTWGRRVPGKILFFSSEGSASRHVPLVPLPHVDDAYPPQRKSFHMLKYLHDHFIDDFEWFIRADDDVFVKTEQLEELLRGVDSRKAWFIGQTGRGSSEEFGMLSLESDENFCMGGPGVIFSRETLKRVAPHVEECLGRLYTTHEDVELGRCVRRFAGISCTWSYEMQVILYHNQSGEAAFSGDLKQKEVHRAITLHPVKQPQHMYRLDKYVKGLKIQSYQQECIDLHRGIASSMSQLGFAIGHLPNASLVEGLPLFPATRGSRGYLGDITLLGMPQSLTRHKPRNLDEVLDWELISKTLYSYKDLNPRRRIGSSLKEGLNDVVRDIMELINSYSKQRGRVIDFKEILYGYWRLDPVHGVDLILDLLLVYRKYRGHKMTVQVRRHAYVQQTFTGIFVREVGNFDSSPTDAVPVHKKIVKHIISTFEQIPPIFPSVIAPKRQTINFILPLSGRFATFRRFLKLYEDVCIKQQEETKLFVILYQSEGFEDSRGAIEGLQRRYSDSGVSVVYINETFSRAKALEYGLKFLSDDDLVLFIDVDMVFDARSLQRVRQNTAKARSIYFPVVYSLYDPKITNWSFPDGFTIDEESGFWRQFGFGIVSLYKSDYRKLGGLNLHISGWGFEDVAFYDTAIQSELRIVRSTDPGLVHIYHPIKCDINLDTNQRNMCLGTQANMLGGRKRLEEIYRRHKHLFS